ncbi:TIM barrel protein [Paucibacter sp. O1-1]|nr:TIM barrel protein [Paucibacter sp. O1-1]MDA3826120.1 TIM barrel protein [Paucibacter sp. O1-1]
MKAAPILISLSSFGASEVLQHGQLHYTRLAQAAGADGVEVRGELLASEAELPALAATGMVKVFSSPTGLWTDGGRLDLRAVEKGLATASQLGATRLKMAIGGFSVADELPALREHLAHSEIELVIENDQTPSAGTVSALQRFFAAADAAGLDLGMVFDMGNWHWLGECPQQAAAALGARVRYVHCKGVQRERSRWIAVPMADSAAPWRAVLRALPRALPWAIEYPLQGADLQATTRSELGLLQDAREQQA